MVKVTDVTDSALPSRSADAGVRRGRDEPEGEDPRPATSVTLEDVVHLPARSYAVTVDGHENRGQPDLGYT